MNCVLQSSDCAFEMQEKEICGKTAMPGIPISFYYFLYSYTSISINPLGANGFFHVSMHSSAMYRMPDA